MMNRTYYSNGKLMISGEYLVLHGASSLVVPLKVGQLMRVAVNGYDNPVIHWNALVMGEPWFNTDISLNDWSVTRTNDENIAINLAKMLKEAARMNPILFENKAEYEITTETAFDQNWGFGSSSALTANIAQWAMIDPFELHFSVSDGSGADVAAAVSKGPLLYRLIKRKPHYCRVDFAPSFMNKLWLVYTGIKKNTAASIKEFNANATPSAKSLESMDEITLEMTASSTLSSFMTLMSRHEKYLSDIWGVPPLKEQFVDFPGEVKSLGAWGGDFIMAASESEESLIRDYFQRKNMQLLFSLDQIILQ
jgi:mevalonate kinase